MKPTLRITSLLISLLFSCATTRAQEKTDTYLLNGFFLRGAYTSFNKAMLLNWDEREVMIDQGKKMISFGAGYAYKPDDWWGGLSVSTNFAATKLDHFRLNKNVSYGESITSDVYLKYNDLNYSLLMFDFDGYIFPFDRIPAALTVGFMLGGSFQSYTITGDTDPFVPNANGPKSLNMFRYGFVLGCKIIPFKFISLDFEYRPMEAYSETISFSGFLYTKEIDGVLWDYYSTRTVTEGPSESMFLMGMSVHF
jgi:hypothetical protein